MIQPKTGFETSDGRILPLPEAQAAELELILTKHIPSLSDTDDVLRACAHTIVAQRKIVIDVLNTNERSRPQRKLVNGHPGNKRRKGGGKEAAPASTEPSADQAASAA